MCAACVLNEALSKNILFFFNVGHFYLVTWCNPQRKQNGGKRVKEAEVMENGGRCVQVEASLQPNFMFNCFFVFPWLMR